MSVLVDRPRELEAALAALAAATPLTRCIAGGTDLVVELQSGRTKPDRVIDLWRVRELRGIREEEGGVRIGALTTCAELMRDPLIAARADLLALAAREVGAVQIRNRATLGGNLGTASPAADLNPVLLALSATVRLRSRSGVRDVPAADFFTGYRSTARRSDELIESVFVPARAIGELRGFRKVGTRRAQSIAKVVVALALSVEDGKVRAISAAAGSVADRTVLLPSLARGLAGLAPTPAAIVAAARAAARDDCSPIDDVRSTARYRRIVLARILAGLVSDLGTVSGPNHQDSRILRFRS